MKLKVRDAVGKAATREHKIKHNDIPGMHPWLQLC